MGLFNDFRIARREAFMFSYKGAALAPYAKKKYDYYTQKEIEARNQVADLLRDATVKASDKRIEDLKRDIETYGNEKEKCLVWAYEFYYRPEETFSLQLGDVTYFDIAKELK